MIETTFSVGNIFTIATVIFAAGGFYWATIAGQRMMSRDIIDLKHDVRDLNKLMTAVAIQNQRIDNFTERLNIIERRYDEIRRGEGLITR
jgi:hypothetical protein